MLFIIFLIMWYIKIIIFFIYIFIYIYDNYNNYILCNIFKMLINHCSYCNYSKHKFTSNIWSMESWKALEEWCSLSGSLMRACCFNEVISSCPCFVAILSSWACCSAAWANILESSLAAVIVADIQASSSGQLAAPSKPTWETKFSLKYY